jgi:ketosteroid isomerase-like protein
MSTDADRAIRDLVARYCHAIAERDDKAWADTWAEDGEWVVLGSAVRGRDAILAHYQRLVSGVRWVVQFAHDGLLEIDGATARGRWQIVEHMQGLKGGGGTNIARYRDAYVRGADGRWRFARRELTATYLGPADLSGGRER